MENRISNFEKGPEKERNPYWLAILEASEAFLQSIVAKSGDEVIRAHADNFLKVVDSVDLASEKAVKNEGKSRSEKEMIAYGQINLVAAIIEEGLPDEDRGLLLKSLEKIIIASSELAQPEIEAN